MMSNCETIIKYLVFAFNFIFFLMSIALIGIGSYISKYLAILGDYGINIILIIGVLMLIVTFFGFFGVRKGNDCMIYTYGAMLGAMMALILISLIGVIVTVYVFKVRIDFYMQ